MSDQSVNGHRARGDRISKAEHNVYFALIFVIALPFAAVAWVFSLIRHGQMPAKDPVCRAWCEARAITPMIFRV